MTPTGAAGTTARPVLVLGSANVDIIIRLAAFPRPGETVFGDQVSTGLGGKGANQAVASALSGAGTTFVGLVGEDDDGTLIRDTLAGYGVDTRGLVPVAGAASGRAYITVNEDAENTIVVVSGANARLDARLVASRQIAQILDDTRPMLALTQGEVPAAAVDALARLCGERDIRFVLNLAPVIPVTAETLHAADPLIVNELEAAALLGLSPAGPTLDVDRAGEAAQEIVRRLAVSAVITLGSEGAVAADGTGSWHQAAPVLDQVVDSTGAGDAFVGALAAGLAAGAGLREAVLAGVRAGSAAAGAEGAASSYGSLPGLGAPPEPRCRQSVG